MNSSLGLYKLLRKLPFKEAIIPFNMLKGVIHNRGFKLSPFVPRKTGGGSLEILHGVPVLRVKGTPGEIGWQYGTLLAPQIQELYDRYLGIFAGRHEHDLALAREMEPHIPLRFLEEIRAYGEASGLGYDRALIGACFLDIHKIAACSTFCVRDASSMTGEVMLGRNLDFPSLGIAHQSNMLVIVEAENRRPIVSVTWPGFLGLISGMNDVGLTFSMMLVYGHTRSDHLKGVPFALHYRDVVERCETVKDAQREFEALQYSVGNNAMMADATRDAAVFELHPHSVGVIRNDSGFPVLRCTNHFRTGHRALSFALTAFSSYPRMFKMWLAERESRREQRSWCAGGIKHLLQEVAIPGISLQRMVFYPERRELEVAFGLPTGGERSYVAFSRDEIWGRGAALRQPSPMNVARRPSLRAELVGQGIG